MNELTIPGYVELALIGHGGLGDVYRATRAGDGVRVAVKVLRDVADSSQAWHRTRRELAALTVLEGHPNVVRPIELLELATGPALVMEYAPGGSVADLFQRRQRPLSTAEVLFVGRQTASALAAAHAAGVVHRDVKPHNLLIDEHGQVKLCDFGIAALTFDDAYRTRTNAVSMKYASPEDLEQDLEVGPAADVYSLGATLLYVAGEGSLTLKDRLTPWLPPDTKNPQHRALMALIAGCLELAADDRPSAATIGDLIARQVAESRPSLRLDRLPVLRRVIDDPQPPVGDCAAGIDHEATTAHRTTRVETPLPEPETSRYVRWVVAAAALIGLCTLASGVWWFVTRGESPAEASATASSTVASTAPTVPAAPVTSPRPSGLDELESEDWGAGEVGDCLVQVADQHTLVVVACDQAHDLQRFASGDVSADGPDVDQAIAAACSDAFGRYVGGSPVTSQLDIATTRIGTTAYECFVGIEDQRLEGDARTSGW